MLFEDRLEAGVLLAEKMSSFQEEDPLILAVPRGGVAVALPLWRRLGGELDLVMARKIGAPAQPELAVGAVTADGRMLINETAAARLRVSDSYLEQASAREQAEIARRLRLYRGRRKPPQIETRTVIVVDDGVATGFTLRAALKGVKRDRPRRLILAVPVGPPGVLERLRREVDALCYLEAPPHFSAVGQFYRDFRQVGDGEVQAALREAWGEQ
ncbi:MAG: phosphoribosyltransferase [Firmicutes bacterium]|nr:phosphoribosyltransferase [Bacillota bacterium]